VNERIRFHLDEQVDPEITVQLRRRGIDVTTTVEAGLRTQSDGLQLAFICQEQRVIVTHDDDDFLKIASFCRVGIAYQNARP
jgi:predicted nuclease of predicted toxin-antitoxin system